MSSEPELLGAAPTPSPDSDDDAEVVAISAVVRRSFTAVLALLVVVLAVTLTAAIIDSIGGSNEAAADEVSPITTTTLPAPVTSVPSPATTTEPPTTTTEPQEPSEVFAQFPTKSQLVLWTYNERQVFIVDLDAATSSELDFTELGVPLVESIVGVGDRLVVQSLGDFYAVDTTGAVIVRLNAQGVVQTFGDNKI